jgi:malate synthase
LNNDGFATFDIGYTIAHDHIPNMEAYYHVSSSGYSFDFYNGNHQLSALTYTNIMADEYGSVRNAYSGSGPTFDPQPPCFWILPDAIEIRLVPVPFDGDMDNDGISNKFEDTNDNNNLMDDDDDLDGIINLLDNTVNMGISDSEKTVVKMYPNPVTDGFIIFESEMEINAVQVYDFTGKLLVSKQINSNTLDVSMLSSGTYLLKLKANDGLIFKKIVIR